MLPTCAGSYRFPSRPIYGRRNQFGGLKADDGKRLKVRPSKRAETMLRTRSSP
jgi:hypothetical protein